MPDLYFFFFGLVCFMIGLLLLAIKIYIIASCRDKVNATITSIKKDKTIVRGSTVYMYIPKFSYSVNGKDYKGTASFSTFSKEKYKEGDTLPIYVSHSNPGNYRFKGRYGMFIWGLLFSSIGLLFMVLYFF